MTAHHRRNWARLVRAIQGEDFLILPHGEELDYIHRKTGDYVRWIKGMRMVNRRFST